MGNCMTDFYADSFAAALEAKEKKRKAFIDGGKQARMKELQAKYAELRELEALEAEWHKIS